MPLPSLFKQKTERGDRPSRLFPFTRSNLNLPCRASGPCRVQENREGVDLEIGGVQWVELKTCFDRILS